MTRGVAAHPALEWAMNRLVGGSLDKGNRKEVCESQNTRISSLKDSLTYKESKHLNKEFFHSTSIYGVLTKHGNGTTAVVKKPQVQK